MNESYTLRIPERLHAFRAGLQRVFWGEIRSRRMDFFHRAFVLSFLAYFCFLYRHVDEWLSPAAFHYNSFPIDRLVGFVPEARVPLFGFAAFLVLIGSLVWPRSRALVAL